MRREKFNLFILLAVFISLFLIVNCSAVYAASAPNEMWIEPSETNGIPARIDVFKTQSGSGYVYQLYLPGNAVTGECFLSWDGGATATVDGETYISGACPIPAPNTGTEINYIFKDGNATLATFKVATYQGSGNVIPVFIVIDESEGNPTIAEMDGDENHEVECTGHIYINGQYYGMPKIKGRGNATWEKAQDKKPYNVTLDSKINFPNIDSEKTKKWSFLAEVLDRSLLCNRAGFYLAHELGIGQDTTSADVWMNGEYQGCYTVTPKTDSFVTDDGFMIEQDNYLEPDVADGGDPQFKLDGFVEVGASWGGGSGYNRITVKDIGKNLLKNIEAGDYITPENFVALKTIKPWLQNAWDAIRSTGSNSGYNLEGNYYTYYIDLESFAKMYLMHEYVKSFDVCAGSILFNRDGDTAAYKLKAGPLWDLDNAMGSTCQNSSLGNADNRRNGDRRSGQGDFISNVTEYKTSIYKTLRNCPGFMDEVYRQYNIHYTDFQNLEEYVDQMIIDIADSARMNHIKVIDIGHGTWDDDHYYRSNTTLGSGTYVQNYLATTTDSKTNWDAYATNLKTYIHTRSLWFENNYVDNDFVDPTTCTHDYQVVETIPATCTAQGLETSVCSICGDRKEESIALIPHSFNDDGICTVCGVVAIEIAIDCDEHASVTVYATNSFDQVVGVGATSAYPRDKDSGQIVGAGSGQIYFIVNPDDDYAVASVTAEPATAYNKLKGPGETGVENGYNITKITGEFTIVVTTQCAHNYVPTVTEPTCTEGGYTTYICSLCGDSYTANETAALGHTPVTDAAVAPTCTEKGLTEGSHCSVCNAILTEQQEIPANGHIPVADAAVAPTCTEKGLTEGSHCSVCDAVLTEQQEIPANGHSPVTDEATVPTCTETGLTAGSHCGRCGEVFTAQEVIPALGHDYKEVANSAKEATCTEAGKEADQKCSRCDSMIAGALVPAKGHAAADAIEENRTAATCTVEGGYDTVVYCSVCSAELTREHTTISAVGHDYKEVANSAKEATCTEAGKEADQKCSRCDSVIAGAVIPALGHAWGEPVWTWNEDFSEATATFTCEHDETHAETVIANAKDGGIVSDEDIVADKYEEVKKPYTATVLFEEQPYENTVTRVLEATRKYHSEKKSDSGETVKIDVKTDTLEVTISSPDPEAISEAAPVLVASYDDDGRFLGLAVGAQASAEPVKAEKDAESIKIFWIDRTYAPKMEDEEILRMTE